MISVLICASIIGVAQDSFLDLCEKGNKELSEENYSNALEFFNAAFKIGSDNESEVAWNATIAAVCAQKVQDFNKAMEYNNIAIKNNTTDITVYEAQIELAKQLNDNVTMEELLLIGRDKLEGQYERFTTKLLYFYYNKKMYEKVLVTADEVLEYKPDHLKTYYFKGVAYLITGSGKEAIESFQYALSIDSTDINSNKQLGFIYYNQGSTIHDKAKAKYNSLKTPTRLDYHNYRKKIEESITPYKKAIPYLESCYRMPPQEDVQNALFLIYTRLGEKEKAAEHKKK